MGARPMLNVFHREGEVIRNFWARNSSTNPPTPDSTPGTSAPSSRCGTCSTLPPEGRPTDWDEQLSYS